MKYILILLNRNFLILRKNININLCLFFLFPPFLYLFIVSPLSNLFNSIMSSGMTYSYHAVPAVMFICTSIIAFLMPIVIVNRDTKKNFLNYIFSTKVNPNIYFLSVIIFSLICSYVEFIISLFIAIQLSGAGSKLGLLISSNQIIYFSIVIFTSILFFSNLGLLLSNFLKRLEYIIISIIFIFLIISFGSSTFIPIDYYTSTFKSFIETYNIIFHLFDMFISILKSDNINLGTFIISILISLTFYFLNIILFKKNGQKQ